MILIIYANSAFLVAVYLGSGIWSNLMGLNIYMCHTFIYLFVFGKKK